MRRRFLVLMGALAATVIVSVTPALVAGQTRKSAAATGMPRTPWGDPDLQGVWTGTTMTPLERPLQGARAVATDEEAERLAEERRRARDDRSQRTAESARGDSGTYNAFWQDTGVPIKGRTSLIVDPADGRLPPFTPEGLARKKAERTSGAHDPGLRDGPEDRNAGERCIHWERLIAGGSTQHYRFVQVPGYMAIHSERLHENRVIRLDGRPHLPPSVRLWNGDSRGHWEGQTLVVDTTNFNDNKVGDPQGNIAGTSKDLHLIERFTRVDANTINYEATLDDPTTWTRPWTLALPLRKEPEGTVGIYEYACQEAGNVGMVGILAGARAEEKAAAEAGNQAK